MLAKIMLFSFLLFIGVQNATTSTQKLPMPSGCPKVEISASEESKEELILFKADVEDSTQSEAMRVSSMNELTFNWTVSVGTIISGQGKNSIKVDRKGLDDVEKIILTVDITGVNKSGCSCCLRGYSEYKLK